MAEHNTDSQSITETITSQEQSITVTLHMPIRSLKLVLPYLNPIQYAQWIKTQAESAKQRLKSGRDISEEQVNQLNTQMALSLEKLIASFKEQVCQPLQVDPINDSRDIKLFKLRANKHVISVLEEINTWLSSMLEKVSVPNQPIDEKAKEYDAIIRNLKSKMKELQTDKLSVEVHNSDVGKPEEMTQKDEDKKKDDKSRGKRKDGHTPKTYPKLEQPSTDDKHQGNKKSKADDKKAKPDDKKTKPDDKKEKPEEMKGKPGDKKVDPCDRKNDDPVGMEFDPYYPSS